MKNQTLVRGLFLAAISLLFGLNAIRYNLGTLTKAGPGLFPFMVSALLLLIALITIARSRTEVHPLDLNLRNIAILLAALCAFALVSKFADMAAGIVVMVFIAGIAGKTRYSVKRNVLISAGLIAVALAFQKLLGLSLPLF